MSDEPPNDPSSPSPSHDEDEGMVPEEELTDALAQASQIASELTKQLETTDPTSAPPSGPTESVLSGNVVGLDAQLNDLDQLLAITGHELAGASDDAPPATTPEATDGSDDSAPTSVPEFMNEFTESGGADKAESRDERPAQAADDPGQGDGASPTGASATGAIRGVVSTGDVGGATGVSTPEPPAVAAEPEAPEVPAEKVSLLARLRQLASGSVSAALPKALPVCDRIVTAFETVDRPFSTLSASLRRIIGWVAIATFGTSMIVLVLSML